MIYLDNGATSFHKPETVYRAMRCALDNCANPGRGGYPAAMARRGLLHLAPTSSLTWNPTATYHWWKLGADAGDETCTLYLRLYLYIFIPLVLLLVFGLPILLVRSLHKTSANELADKDDGKQP